MDVFEAIWTLRAMRRLDSTRDVPDDVILKCIEAAGKAANGGSREDARYLVVRDPEIKKRVAEAYQEVAIPAFDGQRERALHDETLMRLVRSGTYLAEHMADTPALIVVCANGPAARLAPSVYPGVQNFMLAARAQGLGTVLTTVHLRNEAKVKAALGIPDDVSTFCIIPLGYPLGKWGEAKRRPVREITYWNRWEEPAPESVSG